MVYLNDPDIAVAVGDIVRVEITHSDEHDLWGELV
jgi:tRNA A37 methylthiotransferase MiaB